MGDGKHCPSCGDDIGVWPVFSAGMPNRIRCPHCPARLRFRDAAGVFWLMLLVAAGLGVGAAFAAYNLDGISLMTQHLVFVGILFVLWIPVELLVTWYLRNFKELEIIESRG